MEENLTDEEMDMSEEEIDKLCLQKADAEFETSCLEPLRNFASRLEYAKTSGLTDHIPRVSSPYLTFITYLVNDAYRPTLANLIEHTQALVQHQVEGDVWIVSAMAQRASAQAKIDSSIQYVVRPAIGLLIDRPSSADDRVGMKRDVSLGVE